LGRRSVNVLEGENAREENWIRKSEGEGETQTGKNCKKSIPAKPEEFRYPKRALPRGQKRKSMLDVRREKKKEGFNR